MTPPTDNARGLNARQHPYYWAVDFPGLTEEQARDLAERGDLGSLGYGLVADPAIFLTAHLDRATCEQVQRSLQSVEELPDAAAGFLEILTEWLESGPART